MIKSGGLLLLNFVAVIISSSLTEAGQCDDANSFVCPLCENGIDVDDCSECDGFFNTDLNEEICFDRKLFNSNNDSTNKHEDHYPFLWNDIIGAFVWFCAAGIATACGVGGGGIYVPLGVILLRFSSKPASGLSQASIFGASLGGLLLNIRNKHPDNKIRDTIGSRDEDGKVIPYESGKTEAQVNQDEKEYLNGALGRKFYTRPVIDYNMALFLAPMEMAGAVLGVMIQKILPNWLFLTTASVILGLTSYKTYLKFFSAYEVDKQNREDRAFLLEQNTECNIINEDENIVKGNISEEKENGLDLNLETVGNSTSDLEESINTGGYGIIPGDQKKTEVEDDDDEEDLSFEETKSEQIDNDSTISFNTTPVDDDPETLEQRRAFLEADARQYPVEKLLYLILLWIGLALITFLKGGKGVGSVIPGITCKSPSYYVLIAMQFLWTIGFAIRFGLKAVQEREERSKVHYPFHKNDVLWDRRQLNTYAGFSFGAGIVAGLIGIGGGMVLGPLMLMMGVHPRVSTATTATMIVMTSSSVAIMFVISGLVPWEYAIFFFCICITGAYIGKKYIDAYVKTTGMASILIGILATVIGLAAIGFFVIVILNLQKNSWCFDGLKAFCEKEKYDFVCPIRVLTHPFMGTFID